MKAIYFELKESSLSPVASNGETDKDGALWRRPRYVVDVVREKDGGEREREVRKETQSKRRRETKSGKPPPDETGKTNHWR